MSKPAVRGTWVVDQAIKQQWFDEKIDEVFKSIWLPEFRESHPALWDTEAAERTPFPYCCYEVTPLPLTSTTTAKANSPFRRVCTYRTKVSFTIHHDKKELMLPYIEAVARAFDPDMALNMLPDQHVETFRLGDLHVREGKAHWNWVLQYQMHHEGEYALPERPGS